MSLYEIVFSATGRTQRVVDTFSCVWNTEKVKIDLSKPETEEKIYRLEKEDVCIVAVPVYGGRVPAPAALRLRSIQGNGASAILLAVYGNRAVDDCLLELKDILTEQGFRCRAAVSAVAEHSMLPQFGSGRPDEDDCEELCAFASEIKSRLEKGTLPEQITVPGKYPYVQAHNLPLRIKGGSACSKCGTCAVLCPVGAIPKDDLASSDTAKCIRCMRCITVCPQNARAMPRWVGLAVPLMKKKLGGRKGNCLYI